MMAVVPRSRRLGQPPLEKPARTVGGTGPRGHARGRLMGEPTEESSPPQDDPTLIAGSPLGLVAALLHDQERRWELGEPLKVGDYLERHPALRSEPDVVASLIANEIRFREERGETPQPRDYAEQFPD